MTPLTHLHNKSFGGNRDIMQKQDWRHGGGTEITAWVCLDLQISCFFFSFILNHDWIKQEFNKRTTTEQTAPGILKLKYLTFQNSLMISTVFVHPHSTYYRYALESFKFETKTEFCEVGLHAHGYFWSPWAVRICFSSTAAVPVCLGPGAACSRSRPSLRTRTGELSHFLCR